MPSSEMVIVLSEMVTASESQDALVPFSVITAQVLSSYPISISRAVNIESAVDVETPEAVVLVEELAGVSEQAESSKAAERKIVKKMRFIVSSFF